MDKKFRAARVWSNNELRKHACNFFGSVVNVSAWQDSDKEGDHYKNYFSNATSYVITNYGGKMGTSEDVNYEEYDLDLSVPLRNEFIQKFDIVFNHTTLEHVYENRLAFKNLCDMAKDAVIVVVPWLQEVHVVSGGFSDFWRYSPFAMEKLYEENGFDMVVCTYNNEKNVSVYLFCIGIRKEKIGKYPMYKKLSVENKLPAGCLVGQISIIERIQNKLRGVLNNLIVYVFSFALIL